MPEDLWGEIPVGEKQQTPASILREQAAVLIQKTGEELIGKVLPLRGDANFAFRFRIEVPALNGFTVDLFTIKYPIGLYPVDIESQVAGVRSVRCSDIDEYKEELKAFFQSEQVITIIKRLRTQIASIDD